MKIPFSPPDIREEDIQAVVEVLRSGWITTGPIGAQFETRLIEYTGAGGAVLLNSCTAGLELTLRFLGVGPGDEVIVPAYTYTASASVINHVGAQIVMVDTMPGKYIPAIDDLIAAVTPRTKAIITVDLAGIPFGADELITRLEGTGIDSTNELLQKINRPAVIVDAAHSLGAKLNGVNTGQIGDFTAFSFHAVKNLTTAEGGALLWRSDLPIEAEELTRLIRQLSLHGQTKDALSKMKAGAWEYDIVELGYKSNMPDILAALGLSQLKRYDEMVGKRNEIIAKYDHHFGDRFKSIKHFSPSVRSSGHLYLLDLGELRGARNQLIEEMSKKDVSTNVHYKPLPMMTAYKNLGFKIEFYPNAYRQYEGVISLPLYSALTDSQIEYVLDSFDESIEKVV